VDQDWFRRDRPEEITPERSETDSDAGGVRSSVSRVLLILIAVIV
jgi:hypothetical protein